MPNYRLSFMFEFGKSGWSEQWFRSADTLPQAATIAPATLQNFMRIRSDGVLLRALRVNSVDVQRQSQLRILNVVRSTAPAGDWGGGEPAAVAMLGYVTGANFSRRPLLLKGLDDDMVSMNSQGQPVFQASFMTALGQYKSALLGFGAQIQTLRAAGGLNLNRVITELAPANASATQTAVLFTGDPVPIGQRVVFHGLRRSQFPGFGGTVPVVNVTTGGIIVPVAWRGSSATIPGNGATFRVAQFDYNNVTDVIAEDFRSRKVGRPSLLSRGRRSALSFRSR